MNKVYESPTMVVHDDREPLTDQYVRMHSKELGEDYAREFYDKYH